MNTINIFFYDLLVLQSIWKSPRQHIDLLRIKIQFYNVIFIHYYIQMFPLVQNREMNDHKGVFWLYLSVCIRVSLSALSAGAQPSLCRPSLAPHLITTPSQRAPAPNVRANNQSLTLSAPAGFLAPLETFPHLLSWILTLDVSYLKTQYSLF